MLSRARFVSLSCRIVLLKYVLLSWSSLQLPSHPVIELPMVMRSLMATFMLAKASPYFPINMRRSVADDETSFCRTTHFRSSISLTSSAPSKFWYLSLKLLDTSLTSYWEALINSDGRRKMWNWKVTFFNLSDLDAFSSLRVSRASKSLLFTSFRVRGSSKASSPDIGFFLRACFSIISTPQRSQSSRFELMVSIAMSALFSSIQSWRFLTSSCASVKVMDDD